MNFVAPVDWYCNGPYFQRRGKRRWHVVERSVVPVVRSDQIMIRLHVIHAALHAGTFVGVLSLRPAKHSSYMTRRRRIQAASP
jgi:hypothetical protein